MDNKVLQPISGTASQIEVPFIKATFGGVDFGLTDKRNSGTGMINSDFVTSLTVKKYGSGAVNVYTLTMVYVIDETVDPNYVDLVLSKATNREICFSYGDKSKPENSYENEKALITNVVPQVDYRNNKITYTITATSSSTLSYALKTKVYLATVKQPSQVIIDIVKDPKSGIKQALPGMADIAEVLRKGWIPQNDKVVNIAEKRDISPMDYILYLISLMKDTSGNFFFLKVFDSVNNSLPHFEIISTARKEKSKMVTLTIGFPDSTPIYDFNIIQETSPALLVEYRDSVDSGLYQDYSFEGDLIERNYYSAQTNQGTPSDNAKNWWDKITSFPLSATLTTDGLYLPAEIVQSIYLDIYFFGKRYNHSGEYLILEQEDSVSSRGYRTSLKLLRIGS